MSEYLDRQQVIDLYEKHHSHLATYVWEFGQELRQLPIVEERPHESWEYLKEHITEMRDADGELNQKDTCRFILELMGVIEREKVKRNDGLVSL